MIKKILKYTLIAAAWLSVWQILAMLVGQELLFPAPLTVAKRALELSFTAAFYKTVFRSLFRILAGMLLGTVLGALGGVLTAASSLARDFFAPMLALIKATPVASFIILIVLYVTRDQAPLIIALMMVAPIVWTGIEEGILNTDASLLEMARAYKMSRRDKIKKIFLPSLIPYFTVALKSSLGMAWKAGIAAEVLLGPMNSIGKMISDSKTALETTDLFAWTVVVVVLSVIIEKALVFIFKRMAKKRFFIANGGVSLG